MQAFKIVLIGDTSVGKTSIVSRFTHKRFISHTCSTIGASFVSYVVEIDDEKVRLNIWDTAGQERYRSMVSMYYREVDFCSIVFNIQNYKVENIAYWVNEYLNKTTSKNPRFVLVGNKTDLLDLEYGDPVSKKLYDLIDTHNIKLFKTSALNGAGVEELFDHVARILNDIPPYERLNTEEKHGTTRLTRVPQYTSSLCCRN